MSSIIQTRELWLNQAMEHLVPAFSSYNVPANIRCSCGFPSKGAMSNKRKRIGECWSDKASEGKYFEIFIHPCLSEPVEVLETLIHEMAHAVVGLEAKHGGPFKRLATEIGLIGKMTATKASPELSKELLQISNVIGPYPHQRLSSLDAGRIKKGSNVVKAVCPECGYTAVISKKWYAESGVPTCPCGTQMEG